MHLILPLAAAALLAACGGGGEPTPTPVPTEVGALPLCAAADLVAPMLISPANNEVNPVYGEEAITEVHYPDAACQPESFEKFIGPSPSLDGDNFIINPSPVNIFNSPDGFNGSGQLTTALEDCTQYYWKARALVGAAAGPFSEIHTFYTNYSGACPVPESLKPVCDSADIQAPDIISPINGEVNPQYGAEVITEIHYPDASCNPEYFEKFVTDDPNFISDANFIINPGPVNILNPVGEFSGSGQLTTELSNCTQYYFRAHAVVGGVTGPDSDIYTFYIDMNGSCDVPAYFGVEPAAVPSQNANCRQGPSSTSFDVVDTLFAGKEYSPIGQGPDHLWLLFKAPASSGNCWVYFANLDLACHDQPVDLANLGSCSLPIVDYPLIPSPTPTATFTPEPAKPFVPECRDGIDNDGDGRMDFPNDTSCVNANDNDESN
jgi:hypothetical protein